MPKNRKPDPAAYLTEEQLKEEARRKAAEQAKIDALKPPPPPRKTKADNFWYHYKYHLLAGVVVAAFLVFFLRDVVLTTTPDATIILAAAEPISTESLEALEAALSETIEDSNGDGKQLVELNYIYMPPQLSEEELEAMDEVERIGATAGGEQDYASVMKLTTVVAAGVDPIYLVDDALYDYLCRMSLETETDESGNVTYLEPENGEPYTIFLSLDTPAAAGPLRDQLPFSATKVADAPGCEAFQELTFCLRPQLSRRSKEIAQHEACTQLLLSLAR